MFVWKDPRTCMTLPFWLELLDEPPVIVFIHRHPVEVTSSLRTRNSLTTAHGFALWERFNGDALRHSVGLRTIVFEYGALLADPHGNMARLVDALNGWGVHLPNDPATTDMELTPKRRHHEASAGVFDDPASTESQRELYTILPRFAGRSRLLRPPRATAGAEPDQHRAAGDLRAAPRVAPGDAPVEHGAPAPRRVAQAPAPPAHPEHPPRRDAAGRRARRSTVIGVSPEPKIVITGTGRAGTTLLVQVLTDLGLDTGFAADARIDEHASAGLETGIEAPDAPRIVKNPNLSRRLGELLDAGKVEIEHVIIPIRDLDIAAASRVRNTGYGSDLHTLGGLFGTTRATQQREALALDLLRADVHDRPLRPAAHAAAVPALRHGLGVHVREALVPRPRAPGGALAGGDRRAGQPGADPRGAVDAGRAGEDLRGDVLQPRDRPTLARGGQAAQPGPTDAAPTDTPPAAPKQ